MEIIDTNIILRYLVKDDESLYDEAKNIFKKAEDGKRKLLVKVVVIAECCYVLESFYKKTRDEVAESMEVLLSQKWLKVEDRVALLSMWPWYRESMHFVDSFLIACTKIDGSKILTFDRILEKRSSEKIEVNN